MNPLMAACPKCGKLHEVRSEHVGKRLGCSGCAHVFRLEAPDPPRPLPTGKPLKVAEPLPRETFPDEPAAVGLPDQKPEQKRVASPETWVTNIDPIIGVLSCAIALSVLISVVAAICALAMLDATGSSPVVPFFWCFTFGVFALGCWASCAVLEFIRRITIAVEASRAALERLADRDAG